MKPFNLSIDEQKLAALDRLITAAGSRLGDGQLMLLASDVMRWIRSEMEAAQKQAASPKLVEDDAA